MTKLEVNPKKDKNFTFWHSQKIWFLGSVLGSLLFFHAAAETTEGNQARLFLDSHLKGTLKSEPINESLIINRRACQINLEKLAKVEEGRSRSLLLNLFDNTVFTAFFDRIETDHMLGYAWIGRLDGIKDSEVTLVFKDGRLSGTIIFPGGHFQVRHVKDSIHEIREIDSKLMSEALEAVACSDLLSQESEMIVLVNQERAVNSLHLYACDQRLVTASRAHSTDMATNNFFSHTGTGGTTPWDRMLVAGYEPNTAGENIAGGFSTAQAAHEAWMGSPSHRENILNSTFCDIGVGYAYDAGSSYGHYWTEDFARLKGVFVCRKKGTPWLWPLLLFGN